MIEDNQPTDQKGLKMQKVELPRQNSGLVGKGGLHHQAMEDGYTYILDLWFSIGGTFFKEALNELDKNPSSICAFVNKCYG